MRYTRSQAWQSQSKIKDARDTKELKEASSAAPPFRHTLLDTSIPDIKLYRNHDLLVRFEMKRDLTDSELKLLETKRSKLLPETTQFRHFITQHESSSKPTSTRLVEAVGATVIFAADTAGTGICISQDGLVLTCAHCIAESKEEFAETRDRRIWMLFGNGNAAGAKCVTWDPTRDLALLRITAAVAKQQNPVGPFSPLQPPDYPAASLAEHSPKRHEKLFCFGQPGAEDFEVDRPGVKTGYDVFHISEGAFRGNSKGQDVQDNSEIGALMHDCWTYWGHSGAPLISRASGHLIGLHSSWDDQTGMRRGIALDALKAFLQEHTTTTTANDIDPYLGS